MASALMIEPFFSLKRRMSSRGTKGSWGVVFPPRAGSSRQPDLLSFSSSDPSTSMVSGADEFVSLMLMGKGGDKDVSL